MDNSRGYGTRKAREEFTGGHYKYLTWDKLIIRVHIMCVDVASA